MTVTERSSLATVAGIVGAALQRAGIRAALTGGACACLHTRGAYQSADMDFVLVRATTQDRLDGAMATIGFRRRRDRYVHSRTRFYVEFPRGPLAIGADYRVRPVERPTRHGLLLTLSATDSCRDRLAAFYHWNDRQSLGVAVTIALRNRVALSTLRRWSAAEGHPQRFDEFVSELRRHRRRRAEPSHRVRGASRQDVP